MVRVKHTGGVGSILTAKMGHNGGPAWDPTGQQYALDEKYFLSSFDSMGCIVVSPDGTKVFALATSGGQYYLRQYNVPVPYDVSSIVGTGIAAQFIFGYNVDVLRGLDVSSDGTKFIASTNANAVVTVYCPTPWSLTGAYAGTWNTGLTANRQWMSADGLILYQQASGTIYKRTLATAWTPVQAGTVTTTLAESTFMASLQPPASYGNGPYFGNSRFSADGKRFYGYAMSGNASFPCFYAVDLAVPNDLFGGRTFRGFRMVITKSLGPNYSPASYFIGENGKSLFFATSYDSTRGYLTRLKFAP